MSLLWIDGFEGYGTTIDSAPAPSGVMGRRYPLINSESNFRIRPGRIDGKSIAFSASGTYFQTSDINTDSTLIIGVAFKFGVFQNNNAFIVMYDGATAGIGIRVTTGGELEVRLGSTLLDTTSDLNLALNTWYWLELKVVVDDIIGSYELRIGEQNVLSASGIDTKAGSNNYYDSIRLSVPFTGASDLHFDDLYICNGAGTINNNFLGNVKVVAVFPDGAGNSSDFIPSSGANFTCVQEEEVDDDTSYVESSISSHKDTYAYEELDNYSRIKGIQINTDCRETDASSYNIITVIRSGSTDYDDSGQAINTTNYITKSIISELNPSTSSEWLYTDINSSEFGIKVG